MRLFLQAIFVGVVLVFTGLIIFRFISGEDNWICEDGQWVRHGVPISPMPAETCPQE